MQLKSFFIDSETKDLIIDPLNNLKMVEGTDEEDQSIRLLIGTNKSEWFLNILHGLGYEYLQVKTFNEIEAKAEIISTLRQEPRVKDVLEVSFDLDRAKRVLTITFKALMDSGQVIERQVVAQ